MPKLSYRAPKRYVPRTGRTPKNPFVADILEVGLPERVLAFDIEAENVKFSHLEEARVTVAGLIEYRRSGSLAYRPSRY